MVWVFIAFVPWILYWALSGPGLWTAAVSAGLASALALNAYRLARRQAKTMELVTLGFFAAHFAATVVLGSPLFKVYDAVLVGATLAAMAWGTLLAGSPFTYQYAREDWPRRPAACPSRRVRPRRCWPTRSPIRTPSAGWTSPTRGCSTASSGTSA